MPIAVGVQFTPVSKVYHFDPKDQLDLVYKDYVIVDTAKGQEVAQVVQPPHELAPGVVPRCRVGRGAERHWQMPLAWLEGPEAHTVRHRLVYRRRLYQ